MNQPQSSKKSAGVELKKKARELGISLKYRGMPRTQTQLEAAIKSVSNNTKRSAHNYFVRYNMPKPNSLKPRVDDKLKKKARQLGISLKFRERPRTPKQLEDAIRYKMQKKKIRK